MSVTPLITVSEADTYNALSSDWLALTEAEKDAYIFNASLYIQSAWTCADVLWDDPTTLGEDLKRAVAWYSEADRLGVLFDEMVKEDVHGKKTMEKSKVDSLETITQWSLFGIPVNGNPLDVVDALVGLHCIANAAQTTLIRD